MYILINVRLSALSLLKTQDKICFYLLRKSVEFKMLEAFKCFIENG